MPLNEKTVENAAAFGGIGGTFEEEKGTGGSWGEDATASSQNNTNGGTGGSFASKNNDAEINRDKLAESYAANFKTNCTAMDHGKVYLAILLALTDGDAQLFKLLMNRNYEQLEVLAYGAVNENRGETMDPNIAYTCNVFSRALVGRGALSEKDVFTTAQETPAAIELQLQGRRNAAAAAEDPRMYLVHSFYDMVTHDCRGRMLRAFPTFYLAMIDEGRRIGPWKLHDNFYTTNSISELTISKSRKLATDVAEITMSNFFRTFTTEDEDINANYTANFTDIFRSLWLPRLREYFLEQEQKRDNAQPFERFKVRPGARVHIRIGYGSDGSALPIVFNGSVAEVEVGDFIHLTCQSDGSEISQPILLDRQAYEMYKYDRVVGSEWNVSGQTPKTIITSILECNGGAANTVFKEWELEDFTDNYGMSSNPFGLTHFGVRDLVYGYIGDRNKQNTEAEAAGDVAGGSATVINLLLEAAKSLLGNTSEVNDIRRDSVNVGRSVKKAVREGINALVNVTDTYGFKEISQNIFEVGPVKKGERYRENGLPASTEHIPTITFELFGKTIWDVLHICKSTEPRFITSTAPFDFRSTIFFGRPHDYYAYTYQKVDGVWCEKRKPYQQYHIYDSFCDIVDNQIKIESNSVKTCAVGMYTVQGFLWNKVQKKTPPQWIDKDIYPEFQKTYYYDTQLFGMPARPWGKFSDLNNNLNPFENWWNNTQDIVSEWLLGNNANMNGRSTPEDPDNNKNEHNFLSMATVMTRDSLKTAIGEMYQGQLVVIGDPTVKPFDRIMITDTYNEIRGQVQVRDIVQNFSFETGYTTAITPDLIASTVDDTQRELAACYAMQNIGNISSCLASLVRIGDDPTIEITDNSRFADLIDNAIREEQAKNNKAIDSYENAKDDYDQKVKIPSDAWLNLQSMTINPIGGRISIAAKRAVEFLNNPFYVNSSIANYFANWLGSRKVLNLYPLFKYGKVMVGGIDGHMGLVAGSPTFTTDNPIEKYAATWLGSNSWLGSFLKKSGFSHIVAAAEAGNKEFMDKLITDEDLSHGALNAVNESHMSEFRKTLIDPTVHRVDITKSGEAAKAQKIYGISASTEQAIAANERFQRLRYVRADDSLKPFIDIGFLRILGEGKGTGNLSPEKTIPMHLPASPTEDYYSVNAVVGKDNIISLPYLDREALGLLTMITVKTYESMAGTQKIRDRFDWFKNNSTKTLCLKTALQPNSSSFSNTGYSFMLEASDDTVANAMNTAISNIQKMYQDNAKENKNMSSVVFAMQDNNSNKKIANIVVYPPAEEIKP